MQPVPVLPTSQAEGYVIDYDEEALRAQLDHAVRLLPRAEQLVQDKKSDFPNWPRYCVREVHAAIKGGAVMPSEVDDTYTVALVMSTYKRSQQLLTALPMNLATAFAWRNRVLFVLADFNEPEEACRNVEELKRLCPCSCAHGSLRIFHRSAGVEGASHSDSIHSHAIIRIF